MNLNELESRELERGIEAFVHRSLENPKLTRNLGLAFIEW